MKIIAFLRDSNKFYFLLENFSNITSKSWNNSRKIY